MTSLQLQARALGEPSRHRLFELIGNSEVPLAVAELATTVGLHPNAVRQHLAVLVEAGLLREQVAAPTGRGRPRHVYVVHPSAAGRWGALGPYERLAMMLTEVVSTGETPIEVGRRIALATQSTQRVSTTRTAPGDGLAALLDDMDQHGFSPTVKQRGAATTITLHDCPFASAVLTDADVICDLHLGLAQGVAQAAGGLSVASLTRKDPRRAGCVLHCTVDSSADTAADSAETRSAAATAT